MDARFQPFGPVVDLADEIRVAHRTDHDALVAGQFGAFEFDGVACGRDKGAAGNFYGALALGFVMTVRQIERAGAFDEFERIGVFIEAMRGDALWRTAQLRIGCFHHEMIFAHPREHAVRRFAVDHRRGAALQNFCRVPGHAGRKTAHFGQRGEYRRIARTAGEYHVGAGFQRALPRFGAHHADDMRAAVDHRVVELGRRVQRFDAAFGKAFFEISRFLFGVDERDLEAELFGRRDFPEDVVAPREVNIAAGRAGGAHQQGNLQAPRAEQHQSQVAFYGIARKCRVAAAQMAGTGVGGAAITADEVRLLREAQFERFFGKAGTAYAGRRKYAYLVLICLSHIGSHVRAMTESTRISRRSPMPRGRRGAHSRYNQTSKRRSACGSEI